MTDYPKTAKDALEKGADYYFTGSPCKNGHISLRHVKGRYCVECKKQWKKENKELQRKYHKEYNRRVRNPENDEYAEVRKRYYVQKQLRREVAAGRIVKPDKCSECGKEVEVEGHHWDYSKPFDVIWLCRQCHLDLHRKEISDE